MLIYGSITRTFILLEVNSPARLSRALALVAEAYTAKPVIFWADIGHGTKA